MPSIRRLYRITEMARTRGDATWAVLDWAAQQSEPFTVKDLYSVYTKAGGEQGYTSFHTTIGHLTAKPWKDDQDKYAVSEKRPFVVDKKGSRGQGGASVLSWGLDGPLREPPAGEEPGADEDEGSAAVGDALDRLEGMIGREALRAGMARWKGMPIHQAVADIRKTVPKRGQMDALHIASDALVSAGKANMADVEDAENELDYATEPEPTPVGPKTQHQGIPGAPGATSQQAPAVPRRDEPVGRNPGREDEEEPTYEPEPEEMEPDDEDDALTRPTARANEPSPPPPPPGAPRKSSVSSLFKKAQRRTQQEPRESLGMYTGISEPVDFAHTDGQERAEQGAKLGRRKHWT